jgi:photosystem II stability/assembly factor-like uncharacterized protein
VSLRIDIHEALDEIAVPAPALAAELVASIVATEAGLPPRLTHRRSRWRFGFRNPTTLVAAVLIVLLVIALIIGGRLWRDSQQFNRPQSVGPGEVTNIYTARLTAGTSYVVEGSYPGPSLLYLSGDGGRTWRSSLSVLGTYTYVHFFGNDGVAVEQTSDGQVHVYSTHDRGLHWAQQLSLPGGASGHACFNDAQHGWMMSQSDANASGVVLRTVNGGRSWSQSATVAFDRGKTPQEFLQDLYCWGLSAIGVLTSAGHFHYSLDAGATWVDSNVTEPLVFKSYSGQLWSQDGRAVLPVSPAYPTFHLYTSTDGGQTWLGPLNLPAAMSPSTGRIPMFGVSDAGPGGWWAMTDDQLFISTNGGLTWSQHQIALPQGFVQRNGTFADANRGWVVASQNPSPPQPGQPTPPAVSDVVLETDDGGVTWHQVRVP